jgi:single-strand DNA-binding protein
MASMAKVTIIGNVGRDPEQRSTQTGTMTTSFSVAVNNRRRMPDGSQQEETEWYRVTAFGRLAEVCQQYVTKGQQLYVEGRLRIDRWTGQDGQPRVTADIVASDVQFLGARGPAEEAGGAPAERAPAPAQPAPAARASEPEDLEDLPF